MSKCVSGSKASDGYWIWIMGSKKRCTIGYKQLTWLLSLLKCKAVQQEQGLLNNRIRCLMVLGDDITQGMDNVRLHIDSRDQNDASFEKGQMAF